MIQSGLSPECFMEELLVLIFSYFILQLIATAPKLGSLRSVAKSWIDWSGQTPHCPGLSWNQDIVPGSARWTGAGTCSRNCKGSVGLNNTVFQNLGVLTCLLLKSKNNTISFWPLFLVFLSVFVRSGITTY